ncbi:MAG: TIGR02453 family protein [Pseudomonadota bacterium]
MTHAVEFHGFPDKALPFLQALGFHQNREWFHENKKLYEQNCKTPLGDLVETLSARFEAAKIPLRGTRKTSLYRVNRDVRFSKNKDPYNTHMSALLTRSGTKKDQGFVYMHFANDRSFIASGFYGLESAELRAFRELIMREPDTMRKLTAEMSKHGIELDASGSLKRLPRGFETDEEDIAHWLRLRQFAFTEEIDNAVIKTPEIADRLFELGVRSMPFIEFGLRAVDSVREPEPA